MDNVNQHDISLYVVFAGTVINTLIGFFSSRTLTGQKRVVFTGSDVIIDQMEKYQEEIPFVSTIKKINRYYTLT